MKLRKLFLAASATMLLVSTAQATVIDTFDLTGQRLSGKYLLSSTKLAPEAIGGYRYMEMTVPKHINSATVTITPPGELNHNEENDTDGASAVMWDANGAGLGGIALTGDRFIAAVTAIDVSGSVSGPGFFDISMTVTSAAATNTVTNVGVTSTGIISFSFADFVGVDFSNVNSIRMDIDAGHSSDISIDYVVTIPEPGTLLILGTGLVGLVVGKRRNK